MVTGIAWCSGHSCARGGGKKPAHGLFSRGYKIWADSYGVEQVTVSARQNTVATFMARDNHETFAIVFIGLPAKDPMCSIRCPFELFISARCSSAG